MQRLVSLEHASGLDLRSAAEVSNPEYLWGGGLDFTQPYGSSALHITSAAFEKSPDILNLFHQRKSEHILKCRLGL